LEKGNNILNSIFYEKNSLIFIFLSAFILGWFLSFYKFPWYFLIIFFIALRRSKICIIWIVFLISSYFFGLFYWNKLFDKNKPKLKQETELLTQIKRVDPYYKGYLVLAYSPSIGDFIFKTDKKLFIPGEKCLINFKFKKYKEYLNPFYTEKYKRLLVKGIEQELVLVSDEDFICNFENKFSLEYLRYKLLNFSEKLSKTSKGLFQALVLGVEYNLPEEYLEKLKNQGLYHQLAISGFNLAILFGLFYSVSYFILKYTSVIRIGYPLQNISYLLALPGAFLILAFSGFCPSALRAFVFLSLFVLNKLIFRSTSSLIILFLTAFFILLFQPYLIGNLSFQLSFIATLGLIIGNRLFDIYFKDRFNCDIVYYRFLKFIAYSIFISLIVSFFIAPFIFYINGKFPIGIILNNLLATIFWSFIFIPFSIFIALLSFINENIAIKLSNVLGSLFNFYIKIPFFEIIYKPSVPINIFLLFWCFGIILLFILSKYYKNIYKRYGIFLLVMAISYTLMNYFYTKIFYITIFDVGRANAILIKDQKDYIMIDTGPNYLYNKFNWTKIYLEPVLNKLGIDTMNLIVISHPDMDHCGGLNILTQDFYVKRIISGDFKSEDWQKVNPLYFPETIKTSQAIKINESEFFLFPGKRPYKILNRESLVVYLEYKGLTVLFPGDIDKERFYRMKKRGEILPVEILISPHHGSKWGLDKRILNWLKPEVILTSGRGKYHPHKEFLKLLRKMKLEHYTTFEKGAIYIFPKDDYFLICFEKEKRKNFLASVLFPFIPVYLESDNFCKRFTYNKELD